MPNIGTVRSEWHIRLLTVFSAVVNTWWQLDDPARSFWRCYCNQDPGAYLLLEDDAVFPLLPERIYILPRYLPIRSYCTGPVRHLYVHFDVVGLPQIALRTLFDQFFCAPDTSFLREQIRILRDPVVSDSWDQVVQQCSAKAMLYEVMANYLRDISPERQARIMRLTEALEPIQPAIQYIEVHLGERLLVPQLAEFCFLSEDHFIRRFHRCTGQTPARYIQEQRVIQAAQRLLFTTQSIDQVAQETGLGNRYNFSRTFKQHTGISPAAYRKTSILWHTLPQDS